MNTLSSQVFNKRGRKFLTEKSVCIFVRKLNMWSEI